MDPFALVLLVGLVALILWIWVLGKHYPGNGLEQLGLKSALELIETRESLDAEDLEQMLAGHNARRRARGEREATVSDLELRVIDFSPSSGDVATLTVPTASSTSCSRRPMPGAERAGYPSARARRRVRNSAPDRLRKAERLPIRWRGA